MPTKKATPKKTTAKSKAVKKPVSTRSVASAPVAASITSQNLLILTSIFTALCVIFAVMIFWRYG